jgi:hypothetical protein
MAADQVQRVVLPIRLSADEYLKYYRGSARNVYARDLQGRVVQFPANLLQRFVTKDGIDGVFEITITAAGKLVDIRRVVPEGR